VQQVSVDGTMGQLTDGSWQETRTLAVGTVQPRPTPDTVRTTHPSYFARLTDGATFTELDAGEVPRREVATAGTMVGIVDGAPWGQTVLAVHRPDAVRVLDFPLSRSA
jgi:hypothetical protein